MKFLNIFVLLALAMASVQAYGTKTPPKSSRIISQRLIDEPIEQVEQSNVFSAPTGYQFAYSTGGAQQGQQDVAQHFREETQDTSGYVTGKYGYVDAYGKLRVVNYRAGPDGYHASGDIGPDQEAVRQQRELYSQDAATQQQAAAWAKYGQSNVFGFDASSVPAPVVVQTPQVYTTSSQQSSSNQAESSDWTEVNNQESGNYRVASQRYVQSPASALRDYSATKTVQSNAYVQSPVVYQSTKTVQSSAPYVQSTKSTQSTVSRYVARPSAVVVPVKSSQYNYYYQIPAQQVSKTSSRLTATKTGSYKNEVSGKGASGSYTQQSNYLKSPATNARLVQQTEQTSSKLTDTSNEFYSSSSNYGTKSPSKYSGALKAARYYEAVGSSPVSARSTGAGHTVVNFNQFGPAPFKYSYSY